MGARVGLSQAFVFTDLDGNRLQNFQMKPRSNLLRTRFTQGRISIIALFFPVFAGIFFPGPAKRIVSTHIVSGCVDILKNVFTQEKSSIATEFYFIFFCTKTQPPFLVLYTHVAAVTSCEFVHSLLAM